MISGSVTTGQAITNLSPVAQTTTARPVKLLQARVDIMAGSVAGNGFYLGTTVVTADALTALAVPDADADPGQGWHWWESIFAHDSAKMLRELVIRTARIIRPDFRYILVIDGDSANGGTVNFDIKLRLLWQL